MSMTVSGLQAYQNALAEFTKADNEFKKTSSAIGNANQTAPSSFSETLHNSLGKVNELQTEKSAMVQSFASGENQNVHELMISMQKAGLAVNMTAAVRNKVLEAYKELSRLQF